jgi:hypothetical protein
MTTKISTFTSVALTVVLVCGLTYSAAALAQALAQAATLELQSDDIAYMSASHKVRCIMPAAWQRDCGQ